MLPHYLKKIVTGALNRVTGKNLPHVQILGSKNAPLRILVIANAVIPSVQLGIVAPLLSKAEQGECFIDFITEQEINKQKFAQAQATDWIWHRCQQANPTHIVFCRYSGPHSQVMLDYAQSNNIPTIYCIDDDLLNVPQELGAQKYAFHNAPERLETVKRLMQKVDLVYCSNERLTHRFEQLAIKANFFSGQLFCAGQILVEAKLRPLKKLGYMGFDHAHDFKIALPAIVRILRRFPELTFELFGKIPKPLELEEFGNRVVELPVVQDYQQFLQTLAHRNWDIGICPLVNNEFNYVKNINKWTEYTSVGAAVIASQGTIYDECCREGRGLLVSDSEWEDAFLYLLGSPEARYEQVRKAQKYLQDEFSSDRLTQQLMRIFARSESLHTPPSTNIERRRPA